MKYPTMRFVFDRKHLASKKKKGLVQIEILSEGRRKFISTGVKVYADQWKDKTHVCNRTDCIEINEALELQMKALQAWVNDLRIWRETFDFNKLDEFLKALDNSGSFLDFMEERIRSRSLKASTEKTHKGCLNTLREFGKLTYFNDISLKNIKLFDDFLHQRGYTQVTVHGYHKRLKIYVREALALNHITSNPYDHFKIPRGITSQRKYLTKEELSKIENAVIPDSSIAKVRDCFVFCCYTGLSYADLQSFDWQKNVVRSGSRYVIRDTRVKTDTPYNITILSPALEILKKHNYVLPVISNQQYNLRLKVVAKYADINKALTSHMARHTFATWALSEGVRIENVSKMLGHTNIKTTQIYAAILQKDIEESFDFLEKKIKKAAP